MTSSKIDNRNKGQLFKSPVLEFLTRAPYAISFSYYLLVVIGLLVLNNYLPGLTTGNTIALFLSGLFMWTFYEYMLHRFVFHFISENKFIKRFHYLVHGIHHDFPRDAERVTMPPVPGTIIAFIIFSLHYLIFREYTFAYIAGLFFGYNLYTLIHYATHTWKPIKGFKFWWTYHALHHYKYPDKAYGVSTPLWDYVFKTVPPMK